MNCPVFSPLRLRTNQQQPLPTRQKGFHLRGPGQHPEGALHDGRSRCSRLPTEPGNPRLHQRPPNSQKLLPPGAAPTGAVPIGAMGSKGAHRSLPQAVAPQVTEALTPEDTASCRDTSLCYEAQPRGGGDGMETDHPAPATAHNTLSSCSGTPWQRDRGSGCQLPIQGPQTSLASSVRNWPLHPASFPPHWQEQTPGSLRLQGLPGRAPLLPQLFWLMLCSCAPPVPSDSAQQHPEMFIHEGFHIHRHRGHVSAKKTGKQRPPARLRQFNEFYSSDKSVNFVTEKRAQRQSLVHPRRRVGGASGGRGMGRSLLELPLLAAHRAVLLHLLRVQPLEDAVHVEAVGALAPHQRAVVARHLTCRERRDAVAQGMQQHAAPRQGPQDVRGRAQSGQDLLEKTIAGVTPDSVGRHPHVSPTQ